MRWLLHGSVTSAVSAALERHGQKVRRLSDVGLAADAPASQVIRAAGKEQLDILTADLAVAQAPFEQPVHFARTMVLLNVAADDVEQDDAIDRLFTRYKRLSPGRLYTVTASRVKVRQLPKRKN